MIEEKKTNVRAIRIAIIATCTIALLSTFPITITVFAWGMGNATFFYIVLYPLFLFASIVVITKARLATIFILLGAISYAFLLNYEVGKYFVFELDHAALFWVLFLPYCTYLVLIPLTVRYLMEIHEIKRIFFALSILVALSFPVYSLVERYDMDYYDSIFTEFEIKQDGLILITCKPGFGDTRKFTVNSHSKELAELVKKVGESSYGNYLVINTTVKRNLCFATTKSFTITKLEKVKLNFDLTWKADEIKGDVSFLYP